MRREEGASESRSEPARLEGRTQLVRIPVGDL
jgi:hypothetical protein